MNVHASGLSRPPSKGGGLLFDPVVDLVKGRVTGLEVSASWGSIQPGAWPEGAWFRDSVGPTLQEMRLLSVPELHLRLAPGECPDAGEGLEPLRKAMADVGQPRDQVVLTFLEPARGGRAPSLRNWMEAALALGFRTALVDSGRGLAGLNLVDMLRPHWIKLEKVLVLDCHRKPVQQALIRAILEIGEDMDVSISATGVERREDLDWLLDMGVRRFQGPLFAPPGNGGLPEVDPLLLRALKRGA